MRRFNCRVETGLISATASSAVTAATPAATSASASPTFARFGLVHRQRPAAMFLVVQTADGGLGLGIGAHFHKSEALAPTGVTIGNDVGTSDLSKLGEQRLQISTGNVVTEISAIQLFSHRKFSCVVSESPGYSFRAQEKQIDLATYQVGRTKERRDRYARPASFTID
jgi:hypothetical protein